MSQKRVLPDPDEPMMQALRLRALAGFLGRVFMVRNSVFVKMTLFLSLIHIFFLLVFVNLPMHKAVNGAASGAAHPPDGAGLFRGLLLCQLAFGRHQLVAPLFHAELRSGGLFLFTFLPEL